MSFRPLVVGGLAFAAVAATFTVAPVPAAHAQPESRAAVVVDLGDGDVRQACVLFRGDAVTGLDVLRAADMQPVVRTYGGEGGAVCKLCGLGCSGGNDCLTCQAPKYWQYWRAGDGAASYSYSSRGAGTSEVTDGDVEGWSWSAERAPPPFRTVESVCDQGPVYRVTSSPAASSTTSTSAATASTTPTAPGTSPTTTSLRSPVLASPTTTVAPTTTSTTPAAPLTPTTSSTTEPAAGGGGGVASGPVDRGEGETSGSSGLAGYLAFAAVLAGLGVLALRTRANMRRNGGAS